MDLKSFLSTFILLFTAAAAAITDGLLPNGNFEQPPPPSALNGTRLTIPDSIPSWQTSGFIEYITSGQTQSDMLLPVPEGAAAVRLGNDASITQPLSVTPGLLYSLTFSVARTCAADERLNISVVGGGVEYSNVIPVQTMYSSNGFDSYSWAWRATTSPIANLTIHNPGFTDDPACGPVIDAVAVKTLLSHRLVSGVRNGDFEEGPFVFMNSSWGVLVPPCMEDRRSPIPGWMVESLKAVRYVDGEHFAVPSRRRAVELVGGREGGVAQVVRTVVGREYVLGFDVGDGRDMCVGEMVVEVFAGRGAVRTVRFASEGKGWWRREEVRFVAEGGRTRVVFRSGFYHRRSDDRSSLCGPVIDDVIMLVSKHK